MRMDSRENQSMPAGNGVAFAAQIFREILFHLQSSLVWHRIQMFKELGHQMLSVFFHHPRRLVSVLVIFEPMLGRQPAHPDVNARL